MAASLPPSTRACRCAEIALNLWPNVSNSPRAACNSLSTWAISAFKTLHCFVDSSLRASKLRILAFAVSMALTSSN